MLAADTAVMQAWDNTVASFKPARHSNTLKQCTLDLHQTAGTEMSRSLVSKLVCRW